MSRTAATGRSGSSADLPSRPDRPRQEIGLHKQNQAPTFPDGFPRRVLLPPQCLQEGRTCRAGEVVGRPMVAPTFIAGTAIKFVGAGIAARLSQSSPHLVGAEPSCRQKKAAPFRFRRGGENSISAASFFLSERQPFHWVAFRFLYPCRSGLPPLTKGRWHLRSKCRRGRRTPVTARFSPFAAQTGPIPVPPA